MISWNLGLGNARGRLSGEVTCVTVTARQERSSLSIRSESGSSVPAEELPFWAVSCFYNNRDDGPSKAAQPPSVANISLGFWVLKTTGDS